MMFFWAFLWWFSAVVVLTWDLAGDGDITILDVIIIGVLSVGGPLLAIIVLIPHFFKKIINWDTILIKRRKVK